MAKEIRISLLGHKDHGKSTLIGRLLHDTGSITADRINEAKAICESLGKGFELAFLLDSFVEEREEGYTLDTTVAQARHGGCIYNLIDVPGHKELVRNMLSGASLADAAILIVSAKEGEGLQDETRLHICLARLLGISRLAVAVNKMDAARFSEARFMEMKQSLQAVLEGFGFEARALAFIPISAATGDNVMAPSAAMPWYHGPPLISLMEGFTDERSGLGALPARMFVQDVYEMDGARVIVGKVESGAFSEGEEITIGPSGARALVEELHGASGGRMGKASAGQNVGMRLSSGASASRGDLCMGSGGAIRPRRRFRARVFCLPGSSILAGERIRLTCSSQEAEATIPLVISKLHPITERAPRMIGARADIGPSETAEVEIETGKDVMAERFSDVPPLGRFIISKEGRIAGVGVVL